MGLRQHVSGRWEQVQTCLVGESGSTGMAKLSPACKLAPLLISAHVTPQHALKTSNPSTVVIAQLASAKASANHSAACLLVQSDDLCAHKLHGSCSALFTQIDAAHDSLRLMQRMIH